MNNLNDLNREKNKCLVEIDFDVSSGKFVKHYIHRQSPNLKKCYRGKL